MPQNKFLVVVNLVLTTAETLLISSFTSKLGTYVIADPSSSITIEIYFHVNKETANTANRWHHTIEKLENDILMTFLVILALHAWVNFSIILLIFTETVALLSSMKVVEI